MKQQIYQNGFWILLGLIIGSLTTLMFKSTPQESTIRIEVVKDSDSIKVIPKSLNEANLREELKKNNIPHASIVLAQAKLESGNFKSNLVQTHQNIFGLKRGNQYRKYTHWTECVKDYKKCISDRYNGGNYYTFLNKIGYADNPNYIELLKEFV